MSDSKCVLGWIQSQNKLPVFIENRVREIRSHSEITYRFVRGKDNPADMPSRGCTLAELEQCNMWWHGPEWLIRPIVQSDQLEETVSEDKNSEIGHENLANYASLVDVDVLLSKEADVKQMETPFGIDMNKHSSLSKLLRITALCQRFVDKLRKRNHEDNNVTSGEISHAEKMWIKVVQKASFQDENASITANKPNNLVKQLGLYIDESGILRCHGRLDHSELTEAARRPIVLPKDSWFTRLLVERYHRRMLHTGVSQTLSSVRQCFWIPHGRSTVRKILKQCLTCRRVEGPPYGLPPMAPLPALRVTESVPFSRTGIDYFGPLYHKNTTGNKKVWVCLFTCMTTRAVHLESVQDMTTDSFLLCLRRFIAMRGTPSIIVSDNAKQFKLANETIQSVWSQITKSKDVHSYSSNEGIKWIFITELAPWMGGFYERLVGLVKRTLRKTIGRRLLTMDQLHTVLKEAEAIVNSRPLVYVGDDVNSAFPITPSHFLTLNSKIGIPEVDISDDKTYQPTESTREKILELWKKGQKLVDQFWAKWREDYLTSLRERTQRRIKTGRVQSTSQANVNDIVLVKDTCSRGQWKFGKITKLHESKDKLIRSATVLLPAGNAIKRPISLLYPLEVSQQTPSLCIKRDVTCKDACENTLKPAKRGSALNARKRIKQIYNIQDDD